jgi:hypothetical protein
MLLDLMATLGTDHHGLRHFGLSVCWLVIAMGAGKRWRLSQQRWVTSLDDRAQVEHGKNFEQLSDAQQKEILGRYRMGRFLLDWTEDERQAASHAGQRGSIPVSANRAAVFRRSVLDGVPVDARGSVERMSAGQPGGDLVAGGICHHPAGGNRDVDGTR